MRKKSALKVLSDFETDVAGNIQYLSRSLQQLSGPADQSRACSMMFQQSYVGFERFLSELIVAQVNKAPTRFVADVTSRIKQSVTATHGKWIASRLSLSFPEHMTVHEVELCLDPAGYSITFPSAKKWVEFAERTLASSHAAPFLALSVDDHALIDAARAIRDQISHRSPGARDRMNAALALLSPTGGNAGLQRGKNEVHTVGAYLRAQFGSGTRASALAARLVAIAGTLAR